MLSKAPWMIPVLVMLAVMHPTGAAERPARRDLLVAAAASLSQLAPQLTKAFSDNHGVDLRFNFGGSNTLARQIIEGARVDVFISADAAQMDAVERAGRLVHGTRFDLLGNQLMIVVTPFGGRLQGTFDPPMLGTANVRRVALGDPAAVPVGVYARQWLQRAGLWSAVAPKVIPLPSSPAVLSAIREGRADVGIVYVTDGPRGAFVVPVSDGPRIAYPAAATRGGREQDAQVFLTFLRSTAARRIFESARFTHLPV